MQESSLKIVVLNRAGAKGNFVYLTELIENNDIVFICEHWLNKHEKFLINNLCKKEETVFFSSPIESSSYLGRPWGGICWVIHKKVKIVNFEQIEEGISILNFNYNKERYSIIGVYLQYNSHKIEHAIRYESQLSLLERKIDEIIRRKEKVFLMGDFNGDIYRKKYNNDFKLHNWIQKTKLLNVLPLVNSPKYTYESGKNRSYLDYVLSDPSDKEIKIEVKIEQHRLNTSDHVAISMILRNEKEESNKRIIKEKEKLI
jgi:hypothetical protein